MDVSTLTSDLHFVQTLTFEAPIDAVFAALWSSPGGNVLEVMHVAGTPRSIGHAQQIRTAYGGVDLLLIETVTAMRRPTHLRIIQQPDGLQRHDPAERDIPFLDSMTADLDGAFERQFGRDPAATEIDFSLADTGQETRVTVEITLLTDQRVGWFGKRLWRRKVIREIAEIAAGIRARL